MSERHNGIVVHWSGAGYGFVRSPGRDRDVFLHASEIGGDTVRIGDKLSFEVGIDRAGRPMARSIRFE
jgi:cold shock CspA family protein